MVGSNSPFPALNLALSARIEVSVWIFTEIKPETFKIILMNGFE